MKLAVISFLVFLLLGPVFFLLFTSRGDVFNMNVSYFLVFYVVSVPVIMLAWFVFLYFTAPLARVLSLSSVGLGRAAVFGVVAGFFVSYISNFLPPLFLRVNDSSISFALAIAVCASISCFSPINIDLSDRGRDK